MPDYYSEHYQHYHRITFGLDPTSFLSPLADRLSPGACVLDVGCGSGRDLLWLKLRGFNVIGFDRCFELAALAKEKVQCPVVVGDFVHFDFSRFAADGLLLVGALVHVPHESFEDVLLNIAACLEPDGHVLLTMKEGDGTKSDGEGRVFTFWQASALDRLLKGMGFRTEYFCRQPSAVGNQDIWLTYVLTRRR
ncbi:MAG: class I SAM-dependent methyltransferase [Syntrophobacteraceae bacterium]